MKKRLLIFFLFVVSISYSQSSILYYKQINKGKQQLIKGDLKEALNYYYNAISNYDKSFARDCYNAIEIAAKINDTIQLDFFIKKAITKGIQLKHLESRGLLENYTKSFFLANIYSRKDSLRTEYLNKINIPIRTEINTMFLEDQNMRKAYYDANFLSRKKIGKQWEELNAKQVIRLIEITKTYGFPGEHLIGLDTNAMHPKIINGYYSAGMPILIFIHHYSQPNLSYDDILINEVKKGNLYNEHYATICDFEAKFGKQMYPNHGFYALKHKPKHIKNLSKLNNKRFNIGLLSIQDLNNLNTTKDFSKFWNRLY